MKKLLAAVALFSMFCLPAFAGDAPAFEIFGGYSLIHAGEVEEYDVCAQTLHGFIAAVEGNVHPNFGIVGEFGFYQNTDSGTETDEFYEYGWEEKYRHIPFLFGPRVSYRGDNVRLFAHYLLGAVRSSVDWYYWEEGEGMYEDSGTESDTSFAQAVGGGIDISLNDTVSIRPAQVDWISIKATYEDISEWMNAFRYSGGIIIKLGSR